MVKMKLTRLKSQGHFRDHKVLGNYKNNYKSQQYKTLCSDDRGETYLLRTGVSI